MNKIIDYIIFGIGSVVAIVGFGCLCGSQFYPASILLFIGFMVLVVWLISLVVRMRRYNLAS